MDDKAVPVGHVCVIYIGPSETEADNLANHFSTETKFKFINHAFSWEEGLECITTHLPQIAFIDRSIPRLNNLQIRDLLNQANLKTHIIMLSHSNQPDWISTLLQVGVQSFLTKPVNKSELLEEINNSFLKK